MLALSPIFRVAGGASAATLSGLEVADGAGNAFDLDGTTFDSDIFAYTATVANAIVRVTVTPTASDADATIGYRDGADVLLTDADPDVRLPGGSGSRRQRRAGGGDGGSAPRR